MFIKKALLTALALSTVACPSLPVTANSQFSDPGILLSSKTIKGTTYEKYSDGFTAEYTLKGYRKELDAEGSDMEMIPGDGDGEDAEEWVGDNIYGPPLNSSPNDSSLQSRLRQFVEVCLSNNHAAKALKESKHYLEIQQTIKATGLSLAIAQELLGRVTLQLGQKAEALARLSDAAKLASKLNNAELKKQFEQQLIAAKRQPPAVANKKASRSETSSTPIGKKNAASKLAPPTPETDSSSTSGSDSTTESASAQLPGFPDIRLFFSPNQGCNFQTEFRQGVKRYAGRLMTIDGKSTHGLTRKEVVDLLQGAPGSSVAVSVLDSDQSEQSITLVRQAAKKFGNPPYSKKVLLDVIDGFDYGCRKFDTRINVHTKASGFQDQNFDVFVRAAVACALGEANATPGADTVFLARQATEGLLALDSVGDFDHAQRLLPAAKSDTTFEPNRSYNSSISRQLICDLASTGRFNDGEYFCKQYLKPSNKVNDNSVGINSQQQQLSNLAEAQRIYAEFLVQQKRPEATAVLNQIFDSRPKLGGYSVHYYQDEFWLPNLLEQIGQYKRAGLWFSESLNQFQSMQKVFSEGQKPPPLHLDQVRQRAYYSWRIADLQLKEQNTSGALDTINAAIADYDRDETPELQKLVDKLGFFFPTKSDLLSKRNSITANKPLAPIPSGAEDSFDDDLKLLRECHQQISSTNKGVSGVVEKLMIRYKARLPQLNFEIPSLNLFDSLMIVARQLSDHRKFSESNKLLLTLKTLAVTKERTPMAVLLPDLELAFNADLQGQRSAAYWKNVESLLSPDRWSNIFPEVAKDPKLANSLALIGRLEANRYLANVFSKADEQKRANLLIQRAFRIYESLKISPLAKVDQSLIERLHIFLLLDRAEIEARTGNYKQAIHDGNEAISICSRTDPAKNDGLNRAFNQVYRTKITEVARIIGGHKGHRIEAIQFLSLANSKMREGATADIELKSTTSRYYGGFYASIDAYLAKILADEGRYKEALPIIKNSITYGINNVPNSTWYLAGEIAEKCNQFADAAHYYSQAEPNFDSFFDGHVSKDARVNLLRRAISCAQKASSFDTFESANLALRLGQLLADSNPEEALRNYEFAYPLIDDSNPRKPNLLGRITSLKSQLKMSNDAAAPKSVSIATPPAATIPSVATALSTITAPSKTSSHPLSEGQMIADEVKRSADELQSLKAKAELSEKSRRSDEWKNWLDYARAEAQVGQIDDAIKSARHGIDKYRRGDDISIYSEVVLLPAGNLRAIPDALRRQGRADDAQLLLNEAKDKLVAQHGPKSSAVAMQYANAVGYWLGSKNDEQALNILDEMLTLPTQVLDVGGQYSSGMSRLYYLVDMLREQKRTDLARSILQRILKSQSKQLESDDYRLSTTKIKMSQLAEAHGDYAEAAHDLFDAIQIRLKYVGLRAVNEQASVLQKLLPKVGRDGDNQWVKTAYMGLLSPPLLRKYGWASEADSLEKDGTLPKAFIDPAYPSEHQRLVGNIDWQREADDALKQAPYSRRTFEANEKLLRSYLTSMNWSALEKAGAILASIYEHQPDALAGRSVGCVPPDTHRLDYYIAAAKSNLKMGKIEEAKKWIKRACDVLPELCCWEYQTLGEFEIDLGDKDSAVQYLDRAVNLLTQQYSAVGSSLPYLYKKIGRLDGAEKAQAKLSALKAAYDKMQAEAKAQNNVFNHVQL
ncbi:MAG: hypothetical protein HYX67_02960 [Candidatus Melainabacteria bacterium]|nr:hypothetical protein [Candidatus Melainabacteria bacterium]